MPILSLVESLLQEHPEMWHELPLECKASWRIETTTHLFTLEPELGLLTPLNFTPQMEGDVWIGWPPSNAELPYWTQF